MSGETPRGQNTWARKFFDLVLPIIAAGIISWTTSVLTLQTKTAILEERQNQNFLELQRTISSMREDVREIRAELLRRP